MHVGIIIVDHGSRSSRSNELLHELVVCFARAFVNRYPIVEPAHMELADPDITAAYARCVARGAERIVICPFFLGPGKHWQSDIPRLAADAAADSSVKEFIVAAPLGIDDLMLSLLDKRISESIEAQKAEECVQN
jgi:sirohydrochlorin ferrochelatase